MTQRHGARVYLLSGPDDGRRVVYVAQTIKSGPAQSAPYKIDHREDGKDKAVHVNYEDDVDLLKAIRGALNGQL